MIPPDANPPIPLPDLGAATSPAPTDPAPETPMLDVHPPHSAVHGWRDFLLHILTITIGLFIALTLEAGVEALHHRHIVAEARENIRHEIEDNQAQIVKNIRYVQEDTARITTNLDTIRLLRTHPKDLHASLQFNLSWSSFNESAWLSARDMGALTYMPYAEVQRYADIYSQQELVNKTAVDLFNRQALAASPLFMEKDPNKLSDQQTQALLHDTAAIYIGLTTLGQMMEPLNTDYTELLKK